MKKRNISNFLLFLTASIFVICAIWQLIEIKYYGGIQHRAVDDDITIISLVVPVISYIMGRKHKEEEIKEKKENKERENMENELYQ